MQTYHPLLYVSPFAIPWHSEAGSRPKVLLGVLNYPSPNWIQMKIDRKVHQVRVLFTKDRFMSPLEEVTPGLVLDVVISRIPELQTLHEPSKRRIP